MSAQLEREVGVYLDIDQTLAPLFAPHLERYAQQDYADIDFSPEQIAWYEANCPMLFDIPQIARFRKENRRLFEDIRSEIRASDELHRTLPVIPNSREGIRRFVSSLQDMGVPALVKGYRTVRPSAITEATQAWLTSNEFPNSGDVKLVASPEQKLVGILNDVQSGQVGKAVLIDDGLKTLVEAARKIAQQDEECRSHLANLSLIGYGRFAVPTVSFYPDIQLSVFHLPSWSRDDVERAALELSVSYS